VAFSACTEFCEHERPLNDGPFMSEKLRVQKFLRGAGSRSIETISADEMAMVKNTALKILCHQYYGSGM
jgi:hypothetical protein